MPVNKMAIGPSGVDLIAAERRRQIDAEGWTPEHDDAHGDGALTCAALSYGEVAAEQLDPHFPGEDRPWMTRTDWPWDAEWWKPVDDDPIRNLVKAGALIAAEIDRLLRAKNGSDAKEVPDADQQPRAD